MTVYIIHILITICLFSTVAISLNFLSGNTGLISIVQAGFYGIGAYATAILSTTFNLSFWLTVPIGLGVVLILSLFIGRISLNFKDDYFVIATFGLQVILFNLFLNWIELTNGPQGISGILHPAFFDGLFSKSCTIFFLAVFLLITTVYLTNILSSSPYGRLLRAIGEDEVYCQSLGKNIFKKKLLAFVISASFASLAGSIYASYISYIDPSSFTVSQSIFILSIIIISGMHSSKMIIFVTSILVLVPEILRFIGFPPDYSSNLRQILYGILLILSLFYRSNPILNQKNRIS